MNQFYHRHNMNDCDDHSEDGQLRSPPSHYMDSGTGFDDHRHHRRTTSSAAAAAAYNSNDEDTPDSLEIKPPQVISSRYAKTKKSSSSSASRDKKHSKSGEHRHKDRNRDRNMGSNDRNANSDGRQVRQHHSIQSGGNTLRHHSSSKTNVSEGPADLYDSRDHYSNKGVYREREKVRVKEYDRKRTSTDKTDGERELEDLRSRLLSKRNKQDIERKIEEHQEYNHRTDSGDNDIGRYAQYEGRRSDKEQLYQHKHHMKRNAVELIDSPEDYADTDGDKYKLDRYKSTEDPELIARRAKLLDATREMTKRKELAREELEARREMRREQYEDKPPHSRRNYETSRKRKHHIKDEIVNISDRSDDDDDDGNRTNNQSEEDDVVDEDDDDTASDSGTNTKSNYSKSDEHSECELPMSPLSVGDLSKSEHQKGHSRTKSRSTSKSRSSSRSRSRSHSRSNSRSHSRSPSDESRSNSRTPSRSPYIHSRDRKASPPSDAEKEKKSDPVPEPKAVEPKQPSPEDELPSYYPGLQGCRSVEEFKCLNRIAEGTYGIVFRAQDKRTEEIVALKRLKMEKEKDGFPITSLREINTLLKGQHPNIVTVREIVVGSNMDKIFIVMDYVEHDFKTLMETMQHRKQSFLPAEVKCLIQQLLCAVAHLHDNWILHRDLKTSNLLLSHKGILKVGDFGLAREYGSPLKPYTSIVVTLWYRAPELLLCCKEYSTPIDMWSVGCIFAEFLAMGALFPGQSETDQLNKIFKFLGTPNEKVWPGYNQLPAVQKIKFTEYPVSNVREKFGRRTSESGLNLLQGLLTYDPKQRLTADQALRNKYFKEAPLPIDPAMLPTWPAKSELGARKALASPPKPPSGGGQFKKLGASDIEESRGFVLGAGVDARQMAMGPGFNLKF